MAGEEKFGYFRLSEGTEGEDGCLSSGSSWLGVLCEWRWTLTTDCFSFVCKKKVAKSSAVIEVVGGGEGGQRREFNVPWQHSCDLKVPPLKFTKLISNSLTSPKYFFFCTIKSLFQMICPLVPECPKPSKRRRRAESLLKITSTLGEKLHFTQILLLTFKS